jgi:hypothetical protein
MMEIIPFFAAFVTILFGFAFYYFLQEVKNN